MPSYPLPQERQNALHTTSFAEQPISKNSLTNFRSAVYKYNQEHGVDLIQQEIEAQAKSFSELLKIDGHTIRMDSLMISSSCRKLSRLEISYSTVSRFIKVIDKNTLSERLCGSREKKSYLLKVSEKTLHRLQLITKMGTSEYQELARKRAGIEGIPSVLRRR